MRSTLLIRLAGPVIGACLAMTASPVAAQDRYVFGNTEMEIVPRATLVLDGITTLVATDTGWISSTGRHIADNANYLTGTASLVGYNSWFNFVLPAAERVSPYTSAVLTLKTGNSVGVSSANSAVLDLFDVNASLLQLDAERSSGDAMGQALYTDLGSGTGYGSYTFGAPTTLGSTISIALNSNFLSRVNAGLLQDFSIGGTLTPSVAAPIPEPATWTMMIAGMGAVGFVMRRRRARVALA